MGAALEKSFLFLTWPTLAPNGQAGTEDAAPGEGRGELLGGVALEQSAEGSASQERSGGFSYFEKETKRIVRSDCEDSTGFLQI